MGKYTRMPDNRVKVKVDDVGRIYIPKNMKDSLNMVEGTEVYAEVVSDKLVLSVDSLSKVCPVCNIVFSDKSFQFCPYCGELIRDREKETKDEE